MTSSEQTGEADGTSSRELTRPQTIAGRLVYAIGDIHGCYGLVRSLLGKVARDVDVRAYGRTPILIFCGDYIDRGPDSALVLDALCWLKSDCPYECHFLIGNHERVLMDYIDNPRLGPDWMRFGGRATLRSYGVDPPDIAAPLELHTMARDDLLLCMPASHLSFLKGLEMLVTLGDYAFVHAGIRPMIPLEQQQEGDILWIREPFLTHSPPEPKVIVHGHTWIGVEPDVQGNRIGIDTGAYETGTLTALRIEDRKIGFIQTHRETG